MTTKIKVHIDPMGYDKKPSGKEIGGIKSRLQKNASPSLVTLEELVQKIATGHSISPGIMSGMSSKDWTEQQLFLVDIDNEEDEPILRMKDAKAICRDNGLSLAFYYQTFSCTKEHPKFRMAFVMDKLLRKIGLSGRSIVPMLIGFGCTVPGVMASRTLPSERDRKMTILLTPFMSCSAKLPIYGFFTAAFFPDQAALVMICLYFGGILMGILMAFLLRRTMFSGEAVPFVMELPNYRMPGAKNVGHLLWDKAKDFLQRAFTVIFVATIVIWFLQTFDAQLNVAVDSAQSLLAMIGQWLAPIFAPLGFSDWRISTALITGISAKEAVVSTLSVLLGTSSAGVSGAIGGLFTPLSAASFLTFTLLYTPCVAAIAAIRREMNSTVRTIGVVILQCTVAWLMAVLVYHVGGLLF